MYGAEQVPSQALRLTMTGAKACAKDEDSCGGLEDAPAMGRVMVDSFLSGPAYPPNERHVGVDAVLV